MVLVTSRGDCSICHLDVLEESSPVHPCLPSCVANLHPGNLIKHVSRVNPLLPGPTTIVQVVNRLGYIYNVS